MKKFLRITLIGGVLSYRALFDWLSPWILIPSFIVTPLAQIMLFAYMGRNAGVATDQFFVIGNAIQYSAIPCLFGMTNTIVTERLENTLGSLFVSPAPRLALVLGRSLPVMVNGFAVSLFALFAGSAVMGVDIRLTTVLPVLVSIVCANLSCTGLGLVNAAFGLRFRDISVVSNVLFGVLLIFTGANVPRAQLPDWIVRTGDVLPMTHSIEAARLLAAGGGVAEAGRLLGTELALGIGYGVVGAVALRLLELRSRRAASLETV
ncbi:ABC transporter permease [Streptomyces sp. H51]|uniref:ABC transporter permease n=1 Tax=Streptomyces sp. H51 TaxID=3111770 RepID=UPI002D79DFD4|nr:ABC transporter permease [Streptomyces sp. H51]